MSMIYSKIIPGTLVVLVMLFGVVAVNPACYAGGALTLVPAEDNDVPQGSQIPKARSQKIEKKVKAHKAKMKGESLEQQTEQLQQKDLPKPQANEEEN